VAKKKVRGVRGLYVDDSENIGFEEWSLEAQEKLNDSIMRMLKEGMALATKEYEVLALLGGLDSGHLNIEVSLPIGPAEFSSPAWVFSLTEIVDYFIDANGFFPPTEMESIQAAQLIRDHLHDLADRIDAALPVEKRRPRHG